jgi:hypothetical protein
MIGPNTGGTQLADPRPDETKPGLCDLRLDIAVVPGERLMQVLYVDAGKSVRK